MIIRMQIVLLRSVTSWVVIRLRLLLRRLLLDLVLARPNVHGLHPIKADSSPIERGAILIFLDLPCSLLQKGR